MGHLQNPSLGRYRFPFRQVIIHGDSVVLGSSNLKCCAVFILPTECIQPLSLVGFSEYTAVTLLHSIKCNRLFVMDTRFVFCEVESELWTLFELLASQEKSSKDPWIVVSESFCSFYLSITKHTKGHNRLSSFVLEYSFLAAEIFRQSIHCLQSYLC
jgi:hypothetical protein